MKRVFCIILLAVFSLPITVLAEEGMWPPQQLPQIAAHLKEMGLEIDPQRLADLTGDPMNAVISLGGCTASFVSSQGLVITNHHCAAGSIQHHSRPDNNLLQNGFMAATLEDELPAAPGSRVYVTVEFRDVTNTILGSLPEGLSGEDHFKEIDQRSKALVADCEKEAGYRCRVASYYGGLSYSLVRQLEIRDVRLVYAPAAGIGVFGGDIDNWMWPRHTGDFAFYRAYVGSDGMPADFDKANVPFQPKHHLKVSPEGLQEGDFVMVAGYPGTTNRYRLASEVEHMFTWGYPKRVELFQQFLDVIASATKDHPDAAIKYASLRSGLENVLKNNRGMLDGFAKSTMLTQKKELETALHEWIKSDPERQAHAAAISKLHDVLAEARQDEERDLYGGLAGRSALLGAARRIYQLSKEKEKPDLERESGFQERDIPRIKQSMERMDRTFDPNVDRAIWRHFILAYHQLPEDTRVADFDSWFGLKPGSADAGAVIDPILDQMYAQTELGNGETRIQLLEASPAQLEASGDPFIKMAVHLYASDRKFDKLQKAVAGKLQQLRPQYMEALLAYLKTKGKEVYPDANSTLRVTYGTVKGYSPADAIDYRPFTSLHGLLAKDTGVDPFNTPPAALEAMRKKTGGEYMLDSIGTVPVNFLTTCDTTGGNSGSPTLNSRGELVGLLFDGNYESMIADWDYLPAVTRSIHVDIRYVLFLMDDVDKADRLLEEMGVLHPTVASND